VADATVVACVLIGSSEVTLEEDVWDERRLATLCRSAGSPEYLVLNIFRGRVPGDVGRAGMELPVCATLWAVLAWLLRKLLTSESLPTRDRFDDVTEVSEFRRGLVMGAVSDVVEVVVTEGRADFRRMDFRGCGCCCSRG